MKVKFSVLLLIGIALAAGTITISSRSQKEQLLELEKSNDRGKIHWRVQVAKAKGLQKYVYPSPTPLLAVTKSLDEALPARKALAPCPSPILIDTQGDGFDLTGAPTGVDFDIDGSGTLEHLAWTSPASDDSWLALDRNGNAIIDDGTELFGNFTPQPLSNSRNGFVALAEFDKPQNGGNSDGSIDDRDSIFSSLRLWQYANHNGLSESTELFSLPALGVSAIDLDHKEKKRRDEHEKWFRYRAKVYDARGDQAGRWAWDVFLTRLR